MSIAIPSGCGTSSSTCVTGLLPPWIFYNYSTSLHVTAAKNAYRKTSRNIYWKTFLFNVFFIPKFCCFFLALRHVSTHQFGYEPETITFFLELHKLVAWSRFSSALLLIWNEYLPLWKYTWRCKTVNKIKNDFEFNASVKVPSTTAKILKHINNTQWPPLKPSPQQLLTAFQSKNVPWVLSWRSRDWLWLWKRYVERQRDEAHGLTM